jgi:Arc/MetJ-type ribon-helix-helix transcriptional regulator
MSSKIVNISLPEELVDKIDTAADADYASRSEYIRQAVVTRLKAQDSYVWEELATGADEVRDKAKKAGYETDADYARAVKEVRQVARKR